MTGCVVLAPVLRRPHRAQPLADSLAASGADVRLLFVCSPDDPAELEAVRATGADVLVVGWPGGSHGDYARKINAGYRATSEPLLFLAADDLHFHPRWLDHAVAQLGPGVGVVGTNDLGSRRVMRGEHSTHSLVTRGYADRGTIDEPRKILHEGYWHEFVDDELVGTAKHRSAWAFAHKARVEHLHPSWGKAPTDDLYDQQARRMKAGRRVFERRRHLWTSP